MSEPESHGARRAGNVAVAAELSNDGALTLFLDGGFTLRIEPINSAIQSMRLVLAMRDGEPVRFVVRDEQLEVLRLFLGSRR